MTTFTERDLDVLNDLIGGFDQYRGVDPRVTERGISPLDCGGTNGSDHSYRLGKLVKLGYAEHRKSGYAWGVSPTRGRYKGSKKYRPTDAGREAARDADL